MIFLKRHKRNGADILVECLLAEGVDVVFGYPGGQVLEIYNALYWNRKKIRHILTAHEQGAAHAADGYARASGKVGVVIATSGPGASNLVTGIATAYLDSVPMVAICGNVDTNQIGRDSFQELDIADITMPITKHNYIVRDVKDLGRILREAFHIARSGRKGPVLVDIPGDVQAAVCDLPIPDPPEERKFVPELSLMRQISDAASIIGEAERPLIYCGGGVVSAGVGEMIRELSEKLDAPVGCSLMGLSAVDDAFYYNLGLTGIYGREYASEAVTKADVIVAVGARFTDRATGSMGEYVSGAKIVQLDIDPAEVDKNVHDAAYVIGDLRVTLRMLIDSLEKTTHKEWMAGVDSLRYQAPKHNRENFDPENIIKLVSDYTSGWIVVTDVGQHQMWAARYYPVSGERSFITSGGLGTMGFGMGAAVGAGLSTGKKVVLFTGDGSFGMNLIELATAVTYKIPLIVIIMNNFSLGMVKQAQKELFGRDYQTDMFVRRTDFQKLAVAFGAKGFRVSDLGGLRDAICESVRYFDRGRVSVIECRMLDDFTVSRYEPEKKGEKDGK